MITIFTPTYNRLSTVKRLFNSLTSQTSKDFEWIVVDDGSTDDTESYFHSISQNNLPFKLTFIKKERGGKHRAINEAVKIAQGNLFFIVDSDDYLTPDAVEKIYCWEKTLGKEHLWAGISGLKGFSEQKNVGQSNPKHFVDAKNSERHLYNLLGDKAEVYFTDVLKKYPFPEFDGEYFISEEVVWNAIARDNYYIRWFNDIIYICEYLPDGLTNDSQKLIKNPKGTLYWALDYFKTYPNNKRKRNDAIHCYYFSVKKQKKLSVIAHELGISKTTCILAAYRVHLVNFLFYILKKIKQLFHGNS